MWKAFSVLGEWTITSNADMGIVSLDDDDLWNDLDSWFLQVWMKLTLQLREHARDFLALLTQSSWLSKTVWML